MNLKGTRYGEVVEPGVPTHRGDQRRQSTDARDLHIQPDWVVDLALTAKLMDDKLGLTLGADNLFDQYPDRVPNNRVLPTPPGGTRESQRARMRWVIRVIRRTASAGGSCTPACRSTGKRSIGAVPWAARI